MKRLLLLLPLLCLFNARPLFAVDWAVWLSGVYCQAREAGLNHSLLFIEFLTYPDPFPCTPYPNLPMRLSPVWPTIRGKS